MVARDWVLRQPQNGGDGGWETKNSKEERHTTPHEKKKVGPQFEGERITKKN